MLQNKIGRSEGRQSGIHACCLPVLLMLACAAASSGCRGLSPTSGTKNNSSDQAQQQPSETVDAAADDAVIVITSSEELAKHVGQVVTLRGKQTRTKIPHVFGVVVDGDYAFSDKTVEVTGRLSSYVVTQADVDAFDQAQKEQPFAAIRPTVGTHFSMSDIKTGEPPKTRLWQPNHSE